MRTMKDILAGYAGIKMSPKAWLFTFRDDARILRCHGMHHEARLLDELSLEYAGRIIGAGC